MGAESTAPIIISPWYRKSWFKQLGVVVAIALAIVCVVAIVIFINWRNSPERQLLEAAGNAISKPGIYHVTAKDTDLKVTLRDQEYSVSGTMNNLPIDAVLAGSTMYVKSSQPAQLYEFLMGSNPGLQPPAIVQAIAQTVVGKWIEVDLDTTTLQSQNAQEIQCVFQERQSISHNPNAKNQWASTYLAHRFLAISNNKSGAGTTYQVAVDHKARTDFYAALQKTSFYQSLVSCSTDTDVLRNIGSDSPVATVKLNNQQILQSLVIEPHSKNPITVTADYKNVPTIKVPTDTVSMDQLIVRFLQSIANLR